MRILALHSLFLLLLSCRKSCIIAAADGGLYPPGLLPLINRGNVLLASGQFNDAAKIYSEAIDQSPNDYLLYYKRATAYFTLQRHSYALDDFEKVLHLTSNTFDNAHLMKARIHLREGHFALARSSLDPYIISKGKDKDAQDLEKDISEGEQLRSKAFKERNAELWNACVDSSSQALRISSHCVEVRAWRAECSLAAGDVESTVGDLTRLSHLLPPSTQLLTRIFKLSYFLLSPSSSTSQLLKQCLHFDPDSRPCLSLRRMAKSFDKSFVQLEELLGKEDWKGIVKFLVGAGVGATGDLWKRYEQALLDNVSEERHILPLIPPGLLEQVTSSPVPTSKSKQSAFHLPLATKISPRRQILVKAICKSYTRLADIAKSSTEYKQQMNKWCEELLTLDGRKEDVDGLVGRAEVLVSKEEFEDAVRTLEKALEVSGRDRDVQHRLIRAQKLLKQSRTKDYYKVLGVSRDADQATIKKAYRKAVKHAHPDKGGTEAKMAALNEAYEVISSPELRARFDQGDDPNDPMSQQGGHPFTGGYGGGHPFTFFQQGGGQQFQFHFSHGR